jgi:hypothetical protein
VFVVPGDLTRLAVDAWLLPTDSRLHVRPYWRVSRDVDAAVAALGAAATADLRGGRAVALPLPGWPATAPHPVLVAVPPNGVVDPGDVVAPLTAGLRAAAAVARTRTGPRRYPLVGMPLFGAAGGGGDPQRGRLLEVVLDVAGRVGAEEDVDIALVLREGHDLAQAHAIRRDRPGTWDELGDGLVATAVALAEKARGGTLVPFLGAGISVSAGLPTWGELVERLTADTDLPTEDREAFGRLPVLDQAHVLRMLHPDRGAFTAAVAAHTRAERYGLAPALLAGLPTTEAVTLNYDELYEKACADVGTPLAVLPHQAVLPGQRWLLKLHGSVSAPETIVLTREDYLGYGRGREALSALAKALLLTRHLLFVGFGLADDHFHELVHDVREVLPPEARHGRLGTALVLSPDRLRSRLWGSDLDLVAMGGDDVAAQGRRTEMFLDCLLAHADRGLSFFLDRRFAHRLTDAETTLRERLLALEAAAGPAERATDAWSVVADALARLRPQPVQRRVQAGDE